MGHYTDDLKVLFDIYSKLKINTKANAFLWIKSGMKEILPTEHHIITQKLVAFRKLASEMDADIIERFTKLVNEELAIIEKNPYKIEDL